MPVTVDKAVCKPREGDLLSHTAHAEDNKYALPVAGSEYNRYKKLRMRKEWRRWSKNGVRRRRRRRRGRMLQEK